jgi:Ca-activated chloride channel family protein
VFTTPEVLLALPLFVGVLAICVLARSRRFRQLKAYLSADPRGRFWPGRPFEPPVSGRWLLRGALLATAGACLVMALAGLGIGSREVPTYRTTAPLVLVLDVSRSMGVEDVPWGRLGAARLLVRRIAGRLPGTSMALTVFAQEAYTLLPPGSDRELLFTYLESLGPDMVTNQGTALESVLIECARVAADMGATDSPVFLILSDGEDPTPAAELIPTAASVQEAGGILAAISFGTEAGGSVPASSQRRGLIPQLGEESSDSGTPSPFSRANPDLLRTLAEEGGGRFASAHDTDEMNSLLVWLEDALGKDEAPDLVLEGVDRWAWLAGIALLALLFEASIPGAFEPKRGSA